MKKIKTYIIWVIVAIIALVGGIFWGKAMGASGAASTQRPFAGAFASSTRGFAGRGAGAGGSVYAGQVASISGTNLTLQLPNGNSEVVFYATSTPVNEQASVPISKVAKGTNVIINGTANSDGSVTAQSIEIANGSTSGNGGRGGNGNGYGYSSNATP